MSTTKIATCSYCGTRAALVLIHAARHELACSACGAPLHEMKWLKTQAKPAPKPSPTRRELTTGGVHVYVQPPRSPTKKKRNKKKTTVARLADWLDDLDFDLDLDLDDLFD